MYIHVNISYFLLLKHDVFRQGQCDESCGFRRELSNAIVQSDVRLTSVKIWPFPDRTWCIHACIRWCIHAYLLCCDTHAYITWCIHADRRCCIHAYIIYQMLWYSCTYHAYSCIYLTLHSCNIICCILSYIKCYDIHSRVRWCIHAYIQCCVHAHIRCCLLAYINWLLWIS